MLKSLFLAVSIPSLFAAPFVGYWYARPSQAQSPPVNFQAGPPLVSANGGNVTVLALMDLDTYNRSGQTKVVYNDYWFVLYTPNQGWGSVPVGTPSPVDPVHGIIVVEQNIPYAAARAKYLHNGAFESGNGPYN